MAEPLGIKQPLLPPKSLGQTAPSLQFMVPLGAKPISILDPSIFAPEGGSEYTQIEQPFTELPFFETPSPTPQISHQTEKEGTQLATDTPIQRQAASPVPTLLPLKTNEPIGVDEQDRFQQTDTSEFTIESDSIVESLSIPDELSAKEPTSSSVSPAPNLEANIQRSQLPTTESRPTQIAPELPNIADEPPVLRFLE